MNNTNITNTSLFYAPDNNFDRYWQARMHMQVSPPSPRPIQINSVS